MKISRIAKLLWRVLRGQTRRCPPDLILVFYIYVITFCIALPLLCHDWIHSVYFTGNQDSIDFVRKVVRGGDLKVAEAQDYFERQKVKQDEEEDNPVPAYSSDSTQPLFAVGIISTRRAQSLGYLTRVTARLHSILTGLDDGHTTLPLFICNVDRSPQEHTEAETLASFVKVVHKYSSAEELKYPDKYEKHKYDYVFCLLKALDYNAEFVILFEDDALPRPDFASIIQNAIEEKILLKHASGDLVSNNEKWLFLKLYYPEKWQGYSKDIKHYLELFGVASLGGGVFILAVRAMSSILGFKRATSLYLLFILGAIYFICIAISVGRPYLLPLRRVHSQTHSIIPSPGCCIPAMLYPSTVVRPLAYYLASITCTVDFSVDLAIDKYAMIQLYKSYLIEPNIVSHIGMVSTMRQNAKKAAEFLD